MIDFEQFKEDSKRKRQSNLEYSTRLIKAEGFNVVSKNQGYHLIVTHNSKTVDFWPSTGKYKIRGQVHYGRGVARLIRDINQP
jgi:hypothetical protein